MQTLLKLFRKIKTFFKIKNQDKLAFIKAFIYMGYFRAFILFIPFNKIRKRMGKVKVESPQNVDDECYKKAVRIARIVGIVSYHTPWESKCLVQALTAQKMLKEQGVSTTLYLGVKKDENNQMIAHAWTRCGNYFVTGGSNRYGYAVVAKFAS